MGAGEAGKTNICHCCELKAGGKMSGVEEQAITSFSSAVEWQSDPYLRKVFPLLKPLSQEQHFATPNTTF